MLTGNNISPYLSQFEKIIKSGVVHRSNIKPSDWVEQNVVMGLPFRGPYRYSKTPYCKEIINRLAPDDPCKWLAWMKGLQIGASAGVIIPGLVYIIRNSPANTYFTVGSPDLVEKATEKLDLVIDNSGTRAFIKPQALRNRAQKSGDTNTKKDFSGGYIVITSANNHKNWRDVSLKYGFFDDFEAVKAASKESGSTRKLIEGRFAAYADNHKIFYVSTPELKEGSNILPAFLLGDQRYYNVECPCCHEPIIFKWNIPEGTIVNPLDTTIAKNNGGIVYELDHHGKVVDKSVGYVCYKCGGFFTDQYKHNQLNGGFWVPTAEPSQLGYYSYHTPSLYAPAGMYDWKHYVHNFVEANPINQPRKEAEYKTFVNTCLGECYEASATETKASSIQKNTRNYPIGTLPEKLSLSDGNGKIILLTCAADMNGTVDDARLDYELVAWTESGASYSIQHGSLGTFVPREGSKQNTADRVKSTYDFNKPNNIWELFNAIIKKEYYTDTVRTMKIYQTGLDCGYYSANYAYPFIDRANTFPYISVVGLKGKGQDDYVRYDKDVKIFKPAQERPNLYILTVGKIKDELAEFMQLRWDEKEQSQPYGFMNFPTPANGLYGFTNYFEHFESEHCVTEANKDGTGVASRWQKKGTNVMNHMWDVRVYNMAMREIAMETMRKELKAPKITWKEFAKAITGGK